MLAAYDSGGLGRQPLGLRPGVSYPLLLQLTEPGGFWIRACDGDKRGAFSRSAYRGNAV